jgi:hypothetical protein
MYRLEYHHKPAKPRHEALGTIESTIEQHLQKLKPEHPTLEIPYDVRDRHIYAIGKTRNGKTTLLYSIIDQDIKNHAGVCVLDPKPSGQKPNLVEMLLQHIPPEREKDVIYFSAANPVPIDVMSWQTEAERQTLAADLMQTFMQFVAQKDGDRWPGILRFVIHTLLDAKGCTFLDIYDFLADESYREKILERVTKDKLKAYWKTYKQFFPKDAATPILNRMSQHILVEPLNIMLGSLNPKLSIDDVIRNKQILLVDLTGAGQETANFIGTLFVSRIQQAVYRDLRTNFYLFADEFQNFQTSAFDRILSEAGGLGLRLTLANQYLDQMQQNIRSAVRGNVATYFVFQIAPEDCSSFKNLMPMSEPEYEQRPVTGLYKRIKDPAPLKPDMLANLPPFTALYAIAGQEPQFKRIPPQPPPPTQEQLDRAESIRKRTLELYACNTSPLPHTSVDATLEPPEPEPTNDPRKNGSPSRSRPAFRPSEQRRGEAPQKKGAQHKRHQDYKPEP